MSTRSNVSILNPNGSVTTQYFHMDGGLTFTGQNLLDNYRTLDDAKKLIETGNYNDNHIPKNPTAATKLMDKNALKSERRPRKTFDRKAWKKKHTQTVEDLKNGLLKEVDNYTQSPEKVVEMLDFMDKFHNYSSRNAMMIQMQRPGATAVGSFAKFKSMGYKVNRGEKGIKIFVPTKATVFYRKNKDGNKELANLKTATKDEKQKIEAGNIETYQKTFYKIGTVFDAPQTNMPKEKYPELYPNIEQQANAFLGKMMAVE